MARTINIRPVTGFEVNKKGTTGPTGPTDPYWSFVKLLITGQGTNGNNNFTDSSSLAQTITTGGNASFSNAQSKWGGTSILISKAATAGWLALSANPAIGTQDFALECWVNLISANAAGAGLFDCRTSGSASDLLTWTLQTNNDIAFYNQGGVRLSNGSGLSTGVWTHLAIARTAGVTSQYVNGTRTSGTASTYSTVWDSQGSGAVAIGNAYDKGVSSIDGYLNDLRLTLGSNRGYTGASITIPTAAMPTQ